MSLNKTLDRLFDEIRREAKRNPDFADRMDAVLRLHESHREVAAGVIEAVASEKTLQSTRTAPRTSPPGPADGRPEAKLRGDPGPSVVKSDDASERARTMGPGSAPRVRAAGPGSVVVDGRGAAPALNPVGMFKREGEAALAAALAAQAVASLRALVAEHNLDPSGETADLDRAGLAAHVVAQAKRRAERDEKLFDY